MLVSVGSSLVILVPTIILHCSQHFTVNLCRKSKKSATTARELRTNSQTYNNNHSTKCSHCLFIPVDDDFNFFPILFLYYVLFILSICVAIIALEITNSLYTDNELNFYSFSLKSYRHHSIFELQQMQTASIHPLGIYICDFIIIYGILILSIWSSLFSFYRYYTTYLSTHQFTSISTHDVLLRFSVFAIPFAILFIIEIHLYFWLWPMVVALYCGFNWYCSWKFASILIKQFEFFTSVEDDYIYSSNNKDMLESVYFMKRTSLLCCLLQTLSLSIFVISYDVDSVYYLPIFWSLSCAGFALNFVRNRQCIKRFFQSKSIKTRLKVADESNKPSSKRYVLAGQTPNDIEVVVMPAPDAVIHDDYVQGQEVIHQEASCRPLNDVAVKDIEFIEDLERNRMPKRSTIQTESLSGYDWDNSRRSSRYKLRKERSNSMPVNIDETVDTEEIDIDQVLRSFNILSKYGFCTAGTLDTYADP
eukprot:32876_1